MEDEADDANQSGVYKASEEEIPEPEGERSS